MSSESSTDQLKAEIKDITECPICTDTLTDARVLPCVHSFCLKCLQTWGKDKTAADSSIECPLCRKPFTVDSGGIEALPVNHFINKLIDVNRSSEIAQGGKSISQMCDICLGVNQNQSAESYCVECGEHLCHACLQRHAVQKLSKNHKTVTLAQKPSPEELLKMSVSYCQTHPSQELNLYCTDCRVTSCVVCYVAEHKEHKCSDIKNSANELSEHIGKYIATMNSQKTETESTVSQIDLTLNEFEQQIKAVENTVAQKYEEMQALMASQYKEILDQLREFGSKRVKQLKILKEESEHELVMIEGFERYWTEVQAKGSSCDIVQAASSLNKRAEDLVSQHEKQKEMRNESSQPNNYKIEFTPMQTVDDKDKNLLGQLTEKIETQSRKCPDWRSLTQNVTADELLIGGLRIDGIAIREGEPRELFLVRYGSLDIEVYNTRDLKTLSRRIQVPGLTTARGLVHSTVDNCLYISNQSNTQYIHRICLNDDSKSGWAVPNGSPNGLSISIHRHLLVSFCNAGRVEEYNTTGGLVRSIQLSEGITGIYHTIELNSGQLAVAENTPQHRIHLTDSSGNIVQSYGRGQGSSPGQLCHPTWIGIDELHNLLVADHNNSKLRVFDGALQWLGDSATSATQMQCPLCFCWDKKNRRLIVGEGSGRLLSINV